MFHGSPLILLIEDDTVFRRLMVAYLELWGARVVEVDNEADGLHQAQLQTPDLVLGNLLLADTPGTQLIRRFKQDFPTLPIIAISNQQKMTEMALALRAGAEDYLVKPIRHWRQVEETISASLKPNALHVCQELNEHMAFFRRQDIAASRLCRGWRQLPECTLGAWQLSCWQSSPWLLADYMRLDQDVLLLLAEFNPLDRDTPVLMTLMTVVLNEPLRQYHNQPGSLLNNPARTLEYINQLILDAGLECRVNLALFRLQANNSRVQLANGGMKGNEWLTQCNVGPLGVKDLTASQPSYACAFPFALRVQGGFGGEMQLTATHHNSC